MNGLTNQVRVRQDSAGCSSAAGRLDDLSPSVCLHDAIGVLHIQGVCIELMDFSLDAIDGVGWLWESTN